MANLRLFPVCLLAVLVLFTWTGDCFAASKAALARPKAAEDPVLSSISSLLNTPEEQIDLAKAKVTIDRLIDPKVDAPNTLRQIDLLAAKIKPRFPAGATDKAKLELLVVSLSQPGPWNDYRPFSYDLNDPFGKNVQNKLLSTYLASRKGNCISMPILLAIIGQKLGLNITLAAAPEHVLAKFRADNGQWLNLEATSFGYKQKVSYQRELDISPRAMGSGIYLRPLSKRESVALMMSTLMEFYGQQNQQNRRIAVADLVLKANSKDTFAMLNKGNAYYLILKQRYMERYRSPEEIPSHERRDYETLSNNNKRWFEKAEALGWVEPTPLQDVNYMQTIQQVKTKQQGGR